MRTRWNALTVFVNISIVASALLGSVVWTANAIATREQTLRKFRRLEIHFAAVAAAHPDNAELLVAIENLRDVGDVIARRGAPARVWALLVSRSTLESLDRMERWLRDEQDWMRRREADS